MIFAALWVVATFVLSLPLTIYTDYIREHQYGLATQDFGGWFGDQLKELLVSVIVVPLLVALIYAAVRRAGARWWVWASGIAFVFGLFSMMLAPVYVDPLFNDYKPLREGAVREVVLSLARANQIPTDHVVEFDASRQTTRISANVAGFLNTTRVALNDNLLNKTSTPEIKAVLGHEMGHYVLNHGLRLSVYFGLIFTFVFFFTHLAFDAALARWGRRLRLEGRADPAALPLAFALILSFVFAGDAAGELDRAPGRSRSRRVRPQCRARAERFCDGGDAAVDLPQDPSRADRGDDLLRSSFAATNACTRRCSGSRRTRTIRPRTRRCPLRRNDDMPRRAVPARAAFQ